MVTILRNENAKIIYEIVISNPEINASQIEKNLELTYSTIHYYLNKLINVNLIEDIRQEKRVFYKSRETNLVFLEKFFDFHERKVLLPKEKKELLESGDPIKFLREYDYVGGDIRYKVAVQNPSAYTISKIQIMINSTEQYLVDDKVKNIEVLAPGESRGVDFILTPLTCGKSIIFATVSYTDYRGNPQSATIKPKDVWIKCPLVIPKHASLNDILSWKKQLLNGVSSIEFSNIPDAQAFKIALDQVNALDLSQINVDETNKSATYSGIAKVTNDKMIIEIEILGQKINLNVWTKELKQATGFLAYIKNLINMALENAKLIQVKAENIGQTILDSLDITQRVQDLINHCDIKASSSDFLIVLGEIGARLERSFPDLSCTDEVQEWREQIQSNYRMGEPLPISVANKLQLKTLQWFDKLIGISRNNFEMYKNAFEDQNIPINQIKAKIHQLNDELVKEQKKYSLNILKYLLVIHNETGLTIYEKNFSDSKLEPDLISGFLTAIQSFGSEISTSETSMKKLVYKDFQIEIEDGDHVRAALILDGEPTSFLIKKLLEFVNLFEREYNDELESWAGNLKVFQRPENLVDKIFS